MTALPDESNSVIQNLSDSLFDHFGIKVSIKREDLIHPIISGNKWRKLKYNLEKAKESKLSTLVTFGGAFSNHIAAVAEAGRIYGFKTIGIIRGDNNASINPTLQKARHNGMLFEFVDRETYRKKDEGEFISKLDQKFGYHYLIPEGGTNCLALKGVAESVDSDTKNYDVLCVSAGTGGTAAGLISAISARQKALCFSALKGDFLVKEIKHLLQGCQLASTNQWEVLTDYHFGGYAKHREPLITFINQFYQKHKIRLDPIYTGKMLFGLFEMIKKGRFKKGTKILVIHTGGLQGIEGFNYINGPLIN